MMQRAIVLLTTLALSISAGTAADLPRSIERVLTGHGIAADQVSILIQHTAADGPVLSHQATVARNPASVMKLVSTWAALNELGPAYTWPTAIHFLGDFDGERLHGDLGLKGYGDPYLVVEELWKLLRALRRSGLQQIRGDLLIDDSFFDVDEPPPGEFDGQPWRAYNVLPNALLVNFSAAQFHFLADAHNGRVRITTDPPISNLTIHNRIELIDGPCRGYQAGISFHVPDPLTASEVVFGGRFPGTCGHYVLNRAVLRPDTLAFGVISALWHELGGVIHGGVRRGRVPADSEPVLTWQSRPLGDIIRAINKHSNNVMTRQLMYTLGAQRYGAPGTRSNGARAVHAHLQESGLDTTTLVIANGAGLSRDERTSASLLNDVLRAAYRSPRAPEFVSSLSLGGLDGTTRSRFGGRDFNGTMHVKTGQLDDVAALAGYVHAGDRGVYTVVILVNARNAHRGPGEELQDAVLEWLLGGQP